MSGRWLALAVAALLAAPAAGVTPPEGGRQAPRALAGPARAEARAEAVEPSERTPAARAAARFLARRGGRWSFDVDPRTGRAALVQGSGIPLVPGRGNTLRISDLGPGAAPDGEVTLAVVERRARALLSEHADLFGLPAGELVLDRAASGPRQRGRLWTVTYRWEIGGVPVEGASVFVRINSGNVTQIGAPLVGPISIDPRPAIDAAQAVAAAVGDGRGDDAARVLAGWPGLLVQVEEDGPAHLRHRLVWSVRFVVPGEIETWEARVDARTGEVLSIVDVNAYHGRVVGGVREATALDPEVMLPLPLVRLDHDAQVASVAGDFLYGGGPAASSLGGSFFDLFCKDGCTSPPQAEVATRTGSGRLDFGLGGEDATGNGRSTPAHRTTFYHLNQVRRIGKAWLPDLPWLDTTVRANVNIAASCNAFWNGAVNAYRSSTSCYNTGEMSSVLQHEWGHGLDGATLLADGATGEATADIVAFHLSHDSIIGPSFRRDGSFIRDLDKSTSPKGTMTRANVGLKCLSGPGPLGYAVHCEGQIYGQAGWDLAQSLIARHGPRTGWRLSERIFFSSLPDAGSYLPERASPVYDAYLQADDDDGNLANGTPNADLIHAAFDAHGISGGARPSTPPCTRPEQPAVTIEPACDRIVVRWSAVPGAVAYEVFRLEFRLDSAPFPVASLPPTQTSFEDDDVAPGVEYAYVVMAEAADGCESTVEGPVAARLVSQPVLTVAEATVDDVPAGNRTGAADPGEHVDLDVAIANVGDLAADGLTASVVPETAGVSMLSPLSAWPQVPAGTVARNADVLRFTTDPALVECGDVMRFRLEPDEASACAGASSWFEVPLGDRATVRSDTFDDAGPGGWTLDQATSTASAGHWTHGRPDATPYQPGDDATPGPAGLCWYTAPNTDGVGTHDVDDGVTTLLSPPIDLAGLSQARLGYARWFGNRDAGEDPQDFLAVEVSSDDGATWVELERLGTGDQAAEWIRREFALEDAIPLTSTVRIRFRASDGPATGNLLEAAVDDVRVERPVCDGTPACSIPPAFAGLAAALPGASCGRADLSWAPATSSCQSAAITYAVHRSTDPDFLPSAATLIAEGLTGTSFADRHLSPGASVTYLVRAVDSRSGEDANLVRRSVVVTASPDLEAPQFDGLVGARPGASCGEVVLDWPAALESCSGPVSYDVHRSTDPGFTPGPGTLVATTLSAGYVDAALPCGLSFAYVVRARDAAGNEDGNLVRTGTSAGTRDRELVHETFESGGAGWAASAADTAMMGRWEWGDPQGTTSQSPNDATPDPGVNAWVTGLAHGGSDGGNDVDNGTTTLLSSPYDLTGASDVLVRWSRWFSNDKGGNPGEDAFDVDVSNDDGSTWTRLDTVLDGAVTAWVPTTRALPPSVPPTATMRFRFVARDLGVGGSVVEAAIDEFFLLEQDRGCTGCAVPVPRVGTILLSRSGEDVVLDWTGDPVSATRFVVYAASGPGFADAVRIGSTDARSFVHEGAALLVGDAYYRVAAVDACGNESALD